LAVAKTIKNHVEMSWEKVRLGDVLKYEQPTKYIVSSENYSNDFKTPVLTAGKSFILGYTNETDGIYNDLPVIIFDDFTADIKFVDFPFKVKSSAMKILKVNEEKADIRFLFYKMQTLNIDCEQHKRYWISKFAIYEIELPPLSTQKRIADILDTADALRRKDQELLTKYDQLAQVIFRDMFGDPVKNEKGWEVKKLGDLIAKLETGVSVNSTDEVYDDNKYCVLKTSCVYSGEFNPTQAKVIIGNEISKAKLNPQKDSIIISRMNTPELVGKSVYIPENYPNLFLPDRLWQTVKTKENHSSLWLSFALKSEMFMDQVSKICSGTSGSMKNISKKEFLDLKIIFPSL
jgi:restriction endonuclease S subunit